MTEMILSLLIAFRVVESSDGLDPKARGNAYQITKVCVDDVNRIYGTRYVFPRCTKNREDSENIIFLYLTYYGMQYYKEHGRIPTEEVLAKIYHVGYEGLRRGRGNKYARKVKEVMDARGDNGRPKVSVPKS